MRSLCARATVQQALAASARATPHAWRMGAIGRAMSGSPAGAAKLRHSTSTPSVGIVREVHYGQLHTDARAAPHACPPINQCSSCTGVYWRGSVVCAFDSVHACMRACGACATCCAGLQQMGTSRALDPAARAGAGLFVCVCACVRVCVLLPDKERVQLAEATKRGAAKARSSVGLFFFHMCVYVLCMRLLPYVCMLCMRGRLKTESPL